MIYTLKWIKDNLSEAILKAIEGTIYSEDWLAGIAMRETGFLIERYANQHLKADVIFSLMKGDYGQRAGDPEKRYHGYSCFQIDIASYPDFIRSGDWKDPLKSAVKAVSVLEEKRKYFDEKMPGLKDDPLHRAITAAYNCGQGNVFKALINHKDVDHFTYNKDYSKEVFRFREAYKTI